MTRPANHCTESCFPTRAVPGAAVQPGGQPFPLRTRPCFPSGDADPSGTRPGQPSARTSESQNWSCPSPGVCQEGEVHPRLRLGRTLAEPGAGVPTRRQQTVSRRATRQTGFRIAAGARQLAPRGDAGGPDARLLSTVRSAAHRGARLNLTFLARVQAGSRPRSGVLPNRGPLPPRLARVLRFVPTDSRRSPGVREHRSLASLPSGTCDRRTTRAPRTPPRGPPARKVSRRITGWRCAPKRKCRRRFRVCGSKPGSTPRSSLGAGSQSRGYRLLLPHQPVPPCAPPAPAGGGRSTSLPAAGSEFPASACSPPNSTSPASRRGRRRHPTARAGHFDKNNNGPRGKCQVLLTLLKISGLAVPRRSFPPTCG